MGAATSAPGVSRALEDAIEALGGEHSKDVSELVDVFERTEGRKEDTGPAGSDLGTSARDIVDSSRRRLKNATELGDVFELPDAVAAALFHRILAVNSTAGDDDTSTGDDDVAASTHAEISLADCVVYLAVCKTKPGAALEEADALFRRGCTLADLAKVAMDDDDDDEDARAPFLATLSRNLARSATGLTKKFPGLAAVVPALLLPSTRAHLAPVLCDPRGGGASPILTRAGAWLLAGTLPPERRREWTRVYSSDGGDGRSFVTFCSRVTASNGPLLVCVRTRGGCVLGGYVSVDAASTMRSDRADFQGDAACFVWSFGKMTKIENVNNDESPAGVYKSTGLNDHHVWCANGFTSDRFPNGLGFGGRVGHHALWIDADLERGHCRTGVSTFGNPRLIGDEAAEGGMHRACEFDGSLAGEFEVDAVEAWAVTPAATEAEPSGGRNEGNGGSGSKGGGVHAVGGWEASQMLDLVSNANGPARETR